LTVEIRKTLRVDQHSPATCHLNPFPVYHEDGIELRFHEA